MGMGTCQLNRVTALLLLVAVAACGGGEEEPATFRLSGRVTTGAGAPVANARIIVLVHKSCGSCGPIFVGPFPVVNISGCAQSMWHGDATTNASGEYVANVVLNDPCSGSAPLNMQAGSSVTCGGDRQLPCYVGSAAEYTELWQQSDAAPRSLNFVVSQKSRIFGTIQFPNGINTTVPPESLVALIHPLAPTQVNRNLNTYAVVVDQSNRFWFGPLEPGRHMVDFCDSLYLCHGAYEFTPPSITVDVLPQADVDISFSAVPI